MSSVVGVFVLGSALGVVVVLSGNSAERVGVAHPPRPQPQFEPPAAESQPRVSDSPPEPGGTAASDLPSALEAVDTVIASYTASDATALRTIRCHGAPGEPRLPGHLPPGIGMRLSGAITEWAVSPRVRSL